MLFWWPSWQEQGYEFGEALAVRTDDFDAPARVLQVRRSVWRRREQAPKNSKRDSTGRHP